MSLAWETTVDDILNVFRKMGHEGTEEQARQILDNVIDFDRVEQAALCGDEMDDQVEYAYADIEEQIKEHFRIP